MHKQKKVMSFVMLIIRNSSNKPLHLHFFLHCSRGEGGWGGGGKGYSSSFTHFYLVWCFHRSFSFTNKNRLNREKSGHFFTQKTRSNRGEQKRIRLFYHPANYHPTTRGALTKSGNIDL